MIDLDLGASCCLILLFKYIAQKAVMFGGRRGTRRTTQGGCPCGVVVRRLAEGDLKAASGVGKHPHAKTRQLGGFMDTPEAERSSGAKSGKKRSFSDADG